MHRANISLLLCIVTHSEYKLRSTASGLGTAVPPSLQLCLCPSTVRKRQATHVEKVARYTDGSGNNRAGLHQSYLVLVHYTDTTYCEHQFVHRSRAQYMSASVHSYASYPLGIVCTVWIVPSNSAFANTWRPRPPYVGKIKPAPEGLVRKRYTGSKADAQSSERFKSFQEHKRFPRLEYNPD